MAALASKPVTAKLYTFVYSHPGHTARLMLERKGMDYELAELLPGMHPVQLRLARFRGRTVPALKLDGRRIQGSLEIARALEHAQPTPPLYPADPERRRAVEEAERWGEREFQEVPRRIFRWGVARRQDLRRAMGVEVGMPLPGVLAAVNLPVAWAFARISRADDERVRADVAELPSNLDRVDALIADGVIGGEEPNAADFQIATTARMLLAFEDLRPAVEGRPAADLAMRHLPEYPGPTPPFLPEEWLAPLRG
jgi:glutathione S-transferase